MELEKQEPVTTVEDRYNADGKSCHITDYLPAGMKLYARPVHAEPVNARLLRLIKKARITIFDGLETPCELEHPASIDDRMLVTEIDSAIADAEAQQAGPVRLTDAEMEAERDKQEPVVWEGAERWEPLAMFLCADENGSDSCHELIWEGYPPEPWGERWQKYEREARRMIDLVSQYAALPVAASVRLTDEQLSDAACNADSSFRAIETFVLRANGFKVEGEQ